MAPDDGLDGISSMKNADLALYRAERDGKEAYHFFEQSLDEYARHRRQIILCTGSIGLCAMLSRCLYLEGSAHRGAGEVA